MAKAEIYRLMYSNHFGPFAELAFGVLHPGEALLRNWHIDVVSHRLSAFIKGHGQRLVINLPPRSLKSFMTSIAMPAFSLGRNPQLRILLLTGTSELADDLRSKILRLMRCDLYRSVFPDAEFTQVKRTLVSPQGGALSVLRYGESIIGKGYDVIVVDDPQSPAQTKDADKRSETAEYFNDSVISRLNSRTTGRVVVVQQRLHWSDLSGVLPPREWDRLVITAVSQTEESFTTAAGVIKRAKGTVICEARDNKETLRRLMSELGPFDFAAQFLQSPFAGDDTEPRKVVRAWHIPPDWDRENDYLPMMYVWVDKTETLREVYFDGTVSPFVFRDPNAELDIDVWERQAMAQQAKLVKESREHFDRLREDQKRPN